jgi:heptosyltransferase-3
VLKVHFPQAKIMFLGRGYTKPVIEACAYVDQFIDLEEFMGWKQTEVDCIIHVFPVAAIAGKAKQLGIPLRIGTTNRIYHWTTCNKLIRLSRKNSDLHEAALNLKLLKGLNIITPDTLAPSADWCGLHANGQLPPRFAALIDPKRVNLILHPKSQGSAREWGIGNFIGLINLLDPQQFNTLISGTAAEKPLLQPIIESVGNRATDISGLLTLTEFMAFINHCDALLANSTGPLHIAGALGRHAFGIYPPIRPIHPGRWAPLGQHVHIFVQEQPCSDCRKNPAACHCMQDITPEQVAQKIRKELLPNA